MLVLESVEERLRKSGAPEECWLWCLHCERFFQARSLAVDALGRHEACPMPGCSAAGLGVMIFFWDDFREPKDPRWPGRPEALEHGMRSPEMGPFYAEASRRRVARTIERFRGSDAFAPLRALGHDLVWTRPLLELAEASHIEGHEIDPAFLRRALFEALPRRYPLAPSRAHAVALELRAFFSFAEIELDAPSARACLRLLAPAPVREIARALERYATV